MVTMFHVIGLEKNKMLNLPFYKSRGHNCAEFVIKSALEYSIPGQRFRIKEIKDLLKRNNDKYPYMFQIAHAFLNLNFNVSYFSNYDLIRLLNMNSNEKEKEYLSYFGDSAENIIKKTDFKSFDYCLERVIKSQAYIRETIDYHDIQRAHANCNLIICLLNWDIFNKRENNYNGHYIIITDISDNYVKFHDVGPFDATPNRIISKNRFLSCWNKVSFFDEDSLFVRAPDG